MCTIVVGSTGDWLDSIRDLRDAGIPVDADLYDVDYQDTYCLCGVDVETALTRAGLAWVVDEAGDIRLLVGPQTPESVTKISGGTP